MARVFVVDRAAFFGGDWPDGFLAIAAADATGFLRRLHTAGRFVDRATAEETPAWKQLIPYCAVRCRRTGGADAGLAPDGPLEGILTVRRTTGQSEARLHGSWSIGLGGHVDPEDVPAGAPQAVDGPSFFAGALQRELAEELLITGAVPKPQFVGLLNDDRTAVGQVHAGLVYVWDLVGSLEQAQATVQIGEISKMQGGLGSLVEFRDLWQDPARFESWSQFLIRAGVAGVMGKP